MNPSDELTAELQADIERKYAEMAAEQQRKREQGGLRGGSMTSSINPYNIAKRREFLEAEQAARNAARQDEELNLKRRQQAQSEVMSGREYELGKSKHSLEEKMGLNAINDSRKKFLLDQERFRTESGMEEKKYGLNRELFANTKHNDAFNRNLQAKQQYLDYQFKKGDLDIRTFAEKSNHILGKMGVQINIEKLNQLKQQYQEEKRRNAHVNPMEFALKVFTNMDAGDSQNTQADLSWLQALMGMQGQDYSHTTGRFNARSGVAGQLGGLGQQGFANAMGAANQGNQLQQWLAQLRMGEAANEGAGMRATGNLFLNVASTLGAWLQSDPNRGKNTAQ
jgi:hypothetical protein